MRLPGGQHLSYCTNVHPGERWDEVRAVLQGPVSQVAGWMGMGASADAPDRSGDFGVGLRLSAEAVNALRAQDDVAALADTLAARGQYVFTLNGFPYGTFHARAVKQGVYAPDWCSEARLHYTCALSDTLAALLPGAGPDVHGSISTLPLGFGADFRQDTARALAAEHLLQAAAKLTRITLQGGPHIALALEPEPHCALETTADAVAYFEAHLWTRAAVARMAALTGLGPARAEQALRTHLGLCLDACHAAVEFEEVGALRAAIDGAGLAVPKVQLSAGLRLCPRHPDARASLSDYLDPVYLHQVVSRRGQRLSRYLDLPDALADREALAADEWRVHFHVPIFHDRLGAFDSTQDFLVALLDSHRTRPLTRHLEVETYTWDVLPPALRSDEVTADIARELRWVRERLGV